MFDDLGPMQLGIILVIVVMVFGAGKLPQAAGSLGKAIREFKKESASTDDTDNDDDQIAEPTPRRKRSAAKRTSGAVKTAAVLPAVDENETEDDSPVSEAEATVPVKKQARARKSAAVAVVETDEKVVSTAPVDAENN